ncbi:MAG TPA: phosphotransferase, partial [Roseiflexaceae bacterium]|nr:phosphotransferase [Roseiflexaceae bacterium]
GLDIERPDELLAYLRRSGHITADEQPAITNLAGGVSNRTVLVERPGGEAWVLKQALKKLRVAVEWYSSPERINREALGLRWLERLIPGASTRLIFEDHSNYVLAMQAVPQPHENWKTMLLTGRLETRHVEQFGQLLGTIHRTAYERRDQIAAAFNDRSFFESLRIEPYYVYTWTQIPETASFYDALIAATRARRLTLVHGDYSPKNILIYQGRLVLLDHEVIHFGDPAFDLGFALAHLLSKAHHVRERRAAFAGAAADFWRSYRDSLGDFPWAADLEPRAVRHTLGCLLARVAGRSTLEYMSGEERALQRTAVIPLIHKPPTTIVELIRAFVDRCY